MRTPVGLAALAACVAAALAMSPLLPRAAMAGEGKGPKPPAAVTRPAITDFKATLDENDEIAALEAIRVALSEVGDGNTYVWYRRHGRLSGLVQPTTSFKDASGRVCRHILLILTTGGYTARAEGVACRLGDGRWQLEG